MTTEPTNESKSSIQSEAPTRSASESSFLLRYHEVALKGDNRGWFEERLAINARKLIERELKARNHSNKPAFEVIRQHGRLLVEFSSQANVPANLCADQINRAALDRLFGISSYSPIRKAPTDIPSLIEASLEEFQRYIREHGAPRSFRILTRRSDKALPEISTEIDRQIGAAIHHAHPAIPVQLKTPDLVLGVEVRFKQSYLWTEKIKGPGGLPVGSNGRVLTLISGGLDSPVAAIQVLRRGSPSNFLHFYGTPFVGEEALQKVEDLVRIINRFQPDPQPLHVVPFGKLQEKIALATDAKMRTVIYRRMMIRIASAYARTLKAQALVTGESLGQVASQTLENMGTINAVADLPILRPLITYDKDEIIEQAHRRGTYETSIRPAMDCCTLFADRHPSTRTTPAQIEEQEARFPVSDWVTEALDSIYVKRPGQ